MKKGQATMALADVAGYVLFILIMIAFYILFALAKKSVVYKIGPEIVSSDTHDLLMAYVQSGATLDGHPLTMAELIAIAEADESHHDQLESQTKRFLELYNPGSYDLLINYDDAKDMRFCPLQQCLSDADIARAGSDSFRIATETVTLPSLLKQQDIEVRLTLRQVKTGE
jgi:hypothetical protein